LLLLLLLLLLSAIVSGVVYYCFPGGNVKSDGFDYSRVSGGQGDSKGAVEMARMEGGNELDDEDSKQLMSKF